MITPNYYDAGGKCLERGNNAETLFTKIANAKGYTTRHATPEKDMYSHYDVVLSIDNVPSVSLDVKARKKIWRGDPNVQDKWTWIELHAVSPNGKGWLYDGTANFIAFEQAHCFLLVDRDELILLVEKLVDKKCHVSRPQDAQYRIYQRKGRCDELTLIETDKLKEIATVWDKI